MAGLSEKDRDQARRVLDEAGGRPRMVARDGKPIELPDLVVDALTEILEAVADGDLPVVLRSSGGLTTEQAPSLLGVSRPTVVRMIDGGNLPAHKVGTHRRLWLSDVLEYQALAASRRRDALGRMTQQAEELGLYS